MRLAIVTPAWRRCELTAICFEQRALVIEELRAKGIEAEQVVVADDGNLRIAREYGFHELQRPNDRGLGWKVNEGWEYAARELEADWVAYVGSDSWVKPEVFLHPWENGRAYSGRPYSVVDASGERLLVTRVTNRFGVGPHVLGRSLTETFRTPFRPAGDTLSKGIDGSICHMAEKYGRRFVNDDGSLFLVWRQVEVDDYQYVGFRSEQNITSYETLKSCWGVREESFSALRGHYPDGLVDAAADFYRRS